MYGWTPADCDVLPWIEVWEHFEESVQARGRALRWQWQVAAMPHQTKKEAIDEFHQRLLKMENFSIASGPPPSVYDLCTNDEDRLALIGSALMTGGPKWLREHPRQAAWMREHGYSAERAKGVYETRMAPALNAEWVPRKRRKR